MKILEAIQEKLGIAFVFVIFVIALPFLLLSGIYWLFKYAFLSLRLRTSWGKEKRALLAYTESPVWGAYLESEVIPKIASQVIVVNRSKEDWKRKHNLERMAVEFWGNNGQANPLGLVLENGIAVKSYEFFEAFRDFKHGKEAKLNAQLQEFISHIQRVSPPNK